MNGGAYSFGETFHCKLYLLTEFLPEICWELDAEEIFFRISYFVEDVWPEVWHKFAPKEHTVICLIKHYLKYVFKREKLAFERPCIQQQQQQN